VFDAEVGKIVKDARAALAHNGFDHPQAHVSWVPVSLDRTGFAEVAELLDGVLRELNEIQARVAGRQANERGRKPEQLSTEVAILHFERRGRRRKRS
jgi:hypothetical protein